MKAAGIVRPDGAAAHHIVARTAKRAIPARVQLERFGVEIDNAANGVYLPQSSGSALGGAYHPRLHTNRYYAEVNRILLQALTRDDAIEVLSEIRARLIDAAFPF